MLLVIVLLWAWSGYNGLVKAEEPIANAMFVLPEGCEFKSVAPAPDAHFEGYVDLQDWFADNVNVIKTPHVISTPVGDCHSYDRDIENDFFHFTIKDDGDLMSLPDIRGAFEIDEHSLHFDIEGSPILTGDGVWHLSYRVSFE